MGFKSCVMHQFPETARQPECPMVPKRPLIILLGKYDWANVGYNLMDAINRFTDWNARCIIINKHPRFDFPHDILFAPDRMMEIKNMMENADFILYISSFFGTSPGGVVPNRKIPSAIWHGGSYFRNQFPMFIRDIHKRYKMVFAHRDLETLGKNIKRLQAPIDTDKFEYQERDWNGPITIGHCPSHRGVKGTHFFEEAAPILKERFGKQIKFSLFEGDWDEVMRKKKKWHIYFDQINEEYELNGATHGYGVALIESACYGSICLCGSKYKDTPIITVRNASDIVKKVTALMNHRDKLENQSIKTREWVIREQVTEHCKP